MTRHRLPSCILVALCSIPLSAQEPTAPPATVQLRGRVVTWQGQPIVGAGIAYAIVDTMPTARLLAEPPLRSDAEGRFVLTVPALASTGELATPSLRIAHKGMAAISRSISWKYEKKDAAVMRGRAAAATAEPARRLDTEVGDVVLPDGARLIGRVRDADGKGLAGVNVVATDLLDNHRALPGQPTSVHCRAVTDASGIFELPCALASGVTIEFVATGHRRERLHGVGQGTPLEVTMRPSGRVAGRVVDASGAIVPGAIVRASYERSGATAPVRAGDDGRFELALEYDGRFRISASRPRAAAARRGTGTPVERAESEVLDGPAANLELVLEKAPDTPGNGTLRVQAVAADGDQPIAEFQAASVWQQFALQNASYLDYQAGHSMRDAENGEATVTGPGENESTTGVVVVLAPGFAPAYLRDVDWVGIEAKEAPKPLVVRLVPEATIGGRVVDESSGAPIAGAKVAVERQQDPAQGRWSAGSEIAKSVTTAADGSFTLAQLGEGDWQVRCSHAERPNGVPVDVKLEASAQLVGLELKLAAGARVAGRITGMEIPTGSKVLLHPVEEPRFSNNHFFNSYSSSAAPDQGKVPVGADGSFAFTGIALKPFYVVLELPSAPRCGGPAYIPLEPLRVRPGGVTRDLDASLDLPGRILGRVIFPKAVPLAVLPVVVAEQLSDEEAQHHFYQNQYAGPRALVQADGSFTLPVVRGRHRLRVVDAVTGLLLAAPPERHEMPVNGEVRVELAVPLHEVVVQLQGPADAGPLTWIDRLEVRHQPAVKEGNEVVFGGDNDQYDMGSGLPVPIGTTSLRLWLPEGKVTLFARGSTASLRRRGDRHSQQPLGREELDLGAADVAPRQVTLRVDGAPAIEAPAPKTDADAGAAEAKPDR